MPRGKAAQQKSRYAASIYKCCGMPFDAAQPKNLIGKLSKPRGG